MITGEKKIVLKMSPLEIDKLNTLHNVSLLKKKNKIIYFFEKRKIVYCHEHGFRCIFIDIQLTSMFSPSPGIEHLN
jgi:hypothetical protein